MKRLINYFKNSWRELAKISWPDRPTTIRLTIAVVVFSVIMAAFIGSIDAGYSALVKKVLLKG